MPGRRPRTGTFSGSRQRGDFGRSPKPTSKPESAAAAWHHAGRDSLRAPHGERGKFIEFTFKPLDDGGLLASIAISPN